MPKFSAKQWWVDSYTAEINILLKEAADVESQLVITTGTSDTLSFTANLDEVAGKLCEELGQLCSLRSFICSGIADLCAQQTIEKSLLTDSSSSSGSSDDDLLMDSSSSSGSSDDDLLMDSISSSDDDDDDDELDELIDNKVRDGGNNYLDTQVAAIRSVMSPLTKLDDTQFADTSSIGSKHARNQFADSSIGSNKHGRSHFKAAYNNPLVADIRAQLDRLQGQLATLVDQVRYVDDQINNNVTRALNANLSGQLADSVYKSVFTDIRNQIACLRSKFTGPRSVSSDLRFQLANIRFRLADVTIQRAEWRRDILVKEFS